MRLVRYTKLIDKAILERRYALATHLAYRCLLEYNRLFMRFLMPQTRYFRQNAFQLSIQVVRYMRSGKALSFRRTRMLFGMLRSSYYLTTLSSHKFGDRDVHVDLATATFARDQARSIAKFLFGSLSEDDRYRTR